MSRNSEAVGEAVLTIASLVLTGALAVLVYQLYGWLRLGVWQPISVVTGLLWLKVSWAQSPSDWIGLHELLAWCPLSLALTALAFVPIALYFAVIAISE